ncbi:response regulator transcription factor [Mycolicibacterium sp. CH28]|uniref:response regulator transcription factor n=1 Tax=Mycolicibacterium sp. CH28 TaxID=2512237 RepID=UPI001F2B2C9F|nr:response regulator transcription factor [Mycolicibacterium sp. CH28]
MSTASGAASRQSTITPEVRQPRTHLGGRQPRVLIIDAERVVAEMLSIALNGDGIHAMTASDGASAVSVARCFDPDLVILDYRLPDTDGPALLQRLLERRPSLPTISLHVKPTGRYRPTRDLRGDAWLFKPFSIEDAMFRVRSALRNNGIDHESLRPIASVGDLVLDEERNLVWRGSDNIVLTPTEFALMRYFVRNSGRTLTTREILGRVWHYDYTGQSSQVRLYVSYLRRRIDDGRDPMIHTLRGVGYVFKPASPLQGAPPSTGLRSAAASLRM